MKRKKLEVIVFSNSRLIGFNLFGFYFNKIIASHRRKQCVVILLYKTKGSIKIYEKSYRLTSRSLYGTMTKIFKIKLIIPYDFTTKILVVGSLHDNILF